MFDVVIAIAVVLAAIWIMGVFLGYGDWWDPTRGKDDDSDLAP